ncbi:uncharacterized protein LOC132603455 [Lycium barbarum]|uniref:uncharacterized protein LOC132603455 n=1 Tax=Lycium barbarum TaxID=112863 RepID=UPI00293F7630|nr:uncharacterized protein LOC132603455 [Lycium barbarum]XP_060172508.1 uncharacterized protein LOC132603455 [Lycium barbarum]XP_060172509.1 uncharacterized protein LOC132603455 [Lycium barbarum]XP_060172510.1 uncharacterized protein LOC132603455 [Lycium barbarum]XP_060172511.1 uncharacterized protein LOC132603455 [Lycium barbarum]XP_060172512.1 uncharacterized protein LOC132603455 [Lycium barbarum]XP_060172513.1 uncharacterized protein LOC132603455 [Lycium barbarum]XP_060172514.1 uncharacte
MTIFLLMRSRDRAMYKILSSLIAYCDFRMPPKGKATAAQIGKTTTKMWVEREPPMNIEEGESHNEALSNTSSAPPNVEGQGGAPAPIPPPVASGQQMIEAIHLLTQLVAVQPQRQNVSSSDQAASTKARDFMSLNPPKFFGSKPDEDPQGFIDEILRTLKIVHASETESVELASYRLRDVAVLWYNNWVLSRGENAPPPVWQEFVDAFNRHYLPPEVRRARADRFLNLRQGNMSAREYIMQFNSLARYTPAMVADMGDRVHRFVSGLGPHLFRDCLTASLQDGMDISRIQAHAQNLEGRQQQQRGDRDIDKRQSKRAKSMGAGSDYRGRSRQTYSRYSGQTVTNAPPRFAGRRFDRSFRSGQGQSLRASDSQFREDYSQRRPPVPQCSQCGILHSAQCRQGLDACYTCGQVGHMMRDCLSMSSRVGVQPTGSTAGSSSARPVGQTPLMSACRFILGALGGRILSHPQM